jgi:hypothetical protein
MAFHHDEERVRAEKARAIGLFRYALIREAADGRLTTKQRGRLVRALAEAEHQGGPRSTGGSGTGAAAGSTRWSRPPARFCPGHRPTCWSWRSP